MYFMYTLPELGAFTQIVNPEICFFWFGSWTQQCNSVCTHSLDPMLYSVCVFVFIIHRSLSNVIAVNKMGILISDLCIWHVSSESYDQTFSYFFRFNYPSKCSLFSTDRQNFIFFQYPFENISLISIRMAYVSTYIRLIHKMY